MATDMAQHQTYVNHMKALMVTGYDANNEQHRRVVLRLAMKCSDLWWVLINYTSAMKPISFWYASNFKERCDHELKYEFIYQPDTNAERSTYLKLNIRL